MNNTVILKINNLCKSYFQHEIIKDFNMEINSGDYVVIFGKSGVGKTTLLSMIGKIEKQTSGNIMFFENNKEIKNDKLVRKKIISTLFQNYMLLNEYTVEHNLKMALYDKKLPKDKKEIMIKSSLKLVNLEDKLKSKVYTLSGGEQQRVALARCILRNTSIILADEPTGNLDDENRDNIREILKQLNQMGKTIIIVSHDPIFKEDATKILELSYIAE